MTDDGRLTDSQRAHLRGLPVYPWLVWSQRVFLGALAFVAVVGPASTAVIVPGFLLLFLAGIISSVATTLVTGQMRRVGAHGSRARRRLSSAVLVVVYGDALVGRRGRS
ncbi:hypothetical protein [Micromonospora sp. NPDC049282]|uniref:hypothetical protein n=1 Tax=Micromonospora sp. NPDC049282 TaxID=3364269 RepID=UPI0037161E0E